jgi:rhodanese-related sulfurtransferase
MATWARNMIKPSPKLMGARIDGGFSDQRLGNCAHMMNRLPDDSTLFLMTHSNQVSVEELAAMKSSEATLQIIDVRSYGEFDSGHVPGAISIPMETLESRLPELNQSAATVLVCQSGTRAGVACNQIGHFFSNVAVLEGGVGAWKSNGQTVIRTTRSGMPLMQQALVGAGLVNAAGVALATLVHPGWIGISAFVSGGLIVAGTTGYCLMAQILKLMPWNRNPRVNCSFSTTGV